MTSDRDYSKLNTEIAVMSNNISYIKKTLDELVSSNDKTESRVTVLEQRVGIFAGFQAAFSVVIGAIATYFSGKR